MLNTALAVSIGFIGACCILAAISRRIVSRKIKPGLIQDLLYEGIASAELCACCFELIIGKLSNVLLFFFLFKFNEIKKENPLIVSNKMFF